MSKKQSRLYEGMYILNASLSEDALKKALDRITKAIKESGGEIGQVHEMGRKKLAYEIGGHKQGYYFLLYFDVDPSFIKEMWREYHLNEDLIRYLNVRAEKVLEKLEFKSLIDVEPKMMKKRPTFGFKKRKSCPFKAAGVDLIDYKDVENLKKFITERGKILPRRITGVSHHYQQLLKKAIKQARHVALLPFLAKE